MYTSVPTPDPQQLASGDRSLAELQALIRADTTLQEGPACDEPKRQHQHAAKPGAEDGRQPRGQPRLDGPARRGAAGGRGVGGPRSSVRRRSNGAFADAAAEVMADVPKTSDGSRTRMVVAAGARANATSAVQPAA